MGAKQVMSDQLRVSSEQVSALLDGELLGDEFVGAVDFLADTPGARDSWDTYHLVGEAMRSSGTPLRGHDPEFVARLRMKLVSETPEIVAASAMSERATGQKDLQISVANDSWWKRVAGLASVALVGVLAWQGAGLIGAGDARRTDVQLAQLPAPSAQVTDPAALVSADGASELMIRDPQLDAMLAAHRQFGGASALQMPSGFLRNATFNEAAR